MNPLIIVSIVGCIVILAMIPVVWWIGARNNLRRMEVKIPEAFSGVEIALTKRYDMLTKLLDTAKGYAKHEKEVLYEVINLRKGMTISDANAASAQMDDLAARINVVAESYPQLRSSEVFRELQAGIRDAEEHLQAARRLYNNNVSIYNQAIVTFPSSLVAKSLQCVPREFFQAEQEKRADVKMDFS